MNTNSTASSWGVGEGSLGNSLQFQSLETADVSGEDDSQPIWARF